MPRSYDGIPARIRKRATINRPTRRKTKLNNAQSSKKKEAINLAIDIWESSNRRVDEIHQSTGVPRSVIATVAFGGKAIKYERGVNTKNAWLSKRMAEVNAGKYLVLSYRLSHAFIQGRETKLSISEFNKLYGREYLEVSQEDRMKYKDTLMTAKGANANPNEPIPLKFGIAASSDIRTTLGVVGKSVGTLHPRTGFAVLCFGARSDFDLPTDPIAFVPEVAEGFCEEVFGVTPIRMAKELEAWLCTKTGPTRSRKT